MLFLGRNVILHALSVFWLFSFVTLQVCAMPAWRTAQIIAESKNVGCVHGCNFGRPDSNSSTLTFTASQQGEPFKFPEFSAGHFLVIPVAAVAALFYHVMKVRAGRPL